MSRRTPVIGFSLLLGLLGGAGCSHLCGHSCPPTCPSASAYRPCNSCAAAPAPFPGVQPNPVSPAPVAPGAVSVVPYTAPGTPRSFAANYPSTPPPPLARREPEVPPSDQPIVRLSIPEM